MGRRSRLMAQETALRSRIEHVPDNTKTATFKWANAQSGKLMVAAHVLISRFGRGKALTAWAITFWKANGRQPTEPEVCQAVDDGTVGRWIDSQNPNKPDRVEFPKRPTGSSKPPEWKRRGEELRAEKAAFDAEFGQSMAACRTNAQIEARINEALRGIKRA